jgi:hypothetical protein
MGLSQEQMSAILAAAGAFPTLFTHNEHIIVPHCDGVAVAYMELPCIPVNPDKYPEWECVGLKMYGQMDATFHDFCVKKNTGCITAYYCTCNRGPRYSGVGIKVSETETWLTSLTVWHTAVDGRVKCPNCADNHEKKQPCPFCGEFHD